MRSTLNTIKIKLGMIGACFALVPMLAAATAIEEGKQYQLVPESVKTNPMVELQDQDNKGQVTVTEFFSFGCPGCNAVAKPLADWEKTQAGKSKLKRVPVVFFKGWDVYAQAYYTAEILGVLDKINLPLFDAIHKERKDLSSKDEMQKFFVAHGVSAEDFNKTFDSFAVHRELERGKMLMRTYRVYAVPTLIVNNKYQTDLQQAGSPDAFINVLSTLVDKAKAS